MKHIARKRFGQNFLVDFSFVDSIVNAIHPQSSDCIVEIGPGQGALTEPLLKYSPLLHVIEIDRDLVGLLRDRFISSQVIIHQADALEFDFSNICALPSSLRIIGNLPYNISTPLLFHLAQYSDLIRDQHFMLQKEVVQRLIAQPNTKNFSRITVMLQARYQIEWLFDVPATAFKPMPQVTSAVVRMIPLFKAQQKVQDWICFSEIVTQAFSQRRKILRNTWAELNKEINLSALGIDLQARAEALSVDTYIRIANYLFEYRQTKNN